MEQQPPEKRKKLKQDKSTRLNIHDSSYGSMITGTSSSSSISLSLFSESDLAETPSTSGCSSEMATALQSKEKKKEKAKEFMKKLKSMLPMKERAGKMDTLSTLEQLVNNMRQLNEVQKRQSEFKHPPPHNGSYHGSDTDKVVQSNMYISVSLKNHVVQTASVKLMEHLGYPLDWWKGRLLKDFLNKKDITTVNSCIALHSSDEHLDSTAGKSTSSMNECSKYFYARIRRFRRLGDGFNIQNLISYCPFRMVITTKQPETSDFSEDESVKHKKALTIYCQPLTSAYIGGQLLPDKRNFSLRHSLFCNYTYVHPNAVNLLGFLPQDLNGMSIFDLYHPEDYQQLLEIHKKIVLSMGQPFKSGSIRLKTRNSCYIEVETEWSSFVNPWSMQLEFIIGQHTVIKGPSRLDLFEDLPHRTEKVELSNDAKAFREKILEVLKKPIQNVFAEPSPIVHLVKEPTPKVAPVRDVALRDIEPAPKLGTPVDKPKLSESGNLETKSAVIDEKGISSIYNQLNYSHNIKRFLMSHPKSFSNVSDEDSLITREDSEDEAINDEEEMPLEIPVVKPPSCGSSTQVHVSEQGHGEEMLGLPAFGDEAMPPGDAGDNVHLLTEEVLKKHTRLQERLYLQTISEEQPLLLNMRRLKSSRNAPLQKRQRPREQDEEMDLAKHPCTNSGVFRSSSNIFMQSFPAVTSSELTTVTTSTQPMFRQAEMPPGLSYDPRFMGQSSQLGYSQYQPGYQSASSMNLHLLQRPFTNLNYFDMQARSLNPIILWPYYPQTGYTLMPQVMSGFYQPHLQDVQAQAGQPQQATFGKSPQGTISQSAEVRGENLHPQPQKKMKTDMFSQNRDSDHPPSSADDTTSSILYLLEADSSTFEDSDNKASSGIAPVMTHNKRTVEPPWLRGIKWNTEIKMRYQMPPKKEFSVLKMDDKFLKKNPQPEVSIQCLEQLLEDISLPGHEDPIDEEADYVMFLGDEAPDKFDLDSQTTEEVYITGEKGQQEEGEASAVEEVVWTCENDDESYDTPVNSHSEDEKSPATPTGAMVKEEVKPEEQLAVSVNNEAKVTEGSGDVSMDTMFINSGQASDNIPLIKRGSSPKDGSLSGDEGSGSDGGQKAEMEDAQSNCSKVSSDLTPSDDRSNEEAGSSMKESDASTKKMKGVSSVSSSNSSNGHTSQEEGSSGLLVKDAEVLIKKLFVPLKVKVSKQLETFRYPYWLIEAHYSPQVALTYKIPTRNLEEVLREDKRKMTDFVQPAAVKQQLLQLLSEIDMKSGTKLSVNPATSAAYTQTFTSTPINKRSSNSDSAMGTLTEEDLSTSDDKSTKEVRSEQRALPHKSMCSSSLASQSSQDITATAETGHGTISKTDSRASLCEKTMHLTMVNSASSVFMGSVPSDSSDVSRLRRCHKSGPHTSSDSIVEPKAGNSRIGSMSASQSTGTLTSSGSSTNVSRMELHLQERFQAIESNSHAGQKIEDIIMSKVFVPIEAVSTTSTETKPTSNIFILNE
ncbi:period 2-like protein [Biomphalaria pfeifferi]|uniref:Period 2-like protein n=1 Tax=Biomphalaria pfeifferi TaxID=112525 RepID=A0AAD8C0W0_BIOPF|nr:period 2-like protein [Biomphalaria pfeifferi]